MNWLFTFEGIDGSGKTTLVNELHKKINNSIITREPRGIKLGLEVWKLVNNKELVSDVWTQLFLFLASHNEHVKKIIKPNLAKGKVVLVDRYIDSTFIYQGIHGGLEITKIKNLLQNTINSPFPRLTFVLDIKPENAQTRLKKRQEANGEWNEWDALKLEAHEKIKNGYLKLKEYFPQRIVIINANQRKEEIVEEVFSMINEVIS